MRAVLFLLALFSAVGTTSAGAVEIAPIWLARTAVVLDLRTAEADGSLGRAAGAVIADALSQRLIDVTRAAPCIDDSKDCLVERGRAAHADLVVHGSIQRAEQEIIVTVAVFDRAARRALGRAERRCVDVHQVEVAAATAADSVLDDPFVGFTAPIVIGSGLVLGGGLMAGVGLTAIVWPDVTGGNSPAAADKTAEPLRGVAAVVVVGGAAILVGASVLVGAALAE